MGVNGGQRTLAVAGGAELREPSRYTRNAPSRVTQEMIAPPAWMNEEDVCGVKPHINALVLVFIPVNINLACAGNGSTELYPPAPLPMPWKALPDTPTSANPVRNTPIAAPVFSL